MTHERPRVKTREHLSVSRTRLDVSVYMLEMSLNNVFCLPRPQDPNNTTEMLKFDAYTVDIEISAGEEKLLPKYFELYT